MMLRMKFRRKELKVKYSIIHKSLEVDTVRELEVTKTLMIEI